MPSYKLYYFDIRARAELIRFVFAQAGVEYEDVRVSEEEADWSKMKPDTPWGTVPFLEVDGKRIGGSIVIARFLSERFGLAGSGDVENAQIAAAIDANDGIVTEVYNFVFEKDEKKKAAMKKELEEKTLPNKLQFFENFIAKSTAPEGWMFNKLTYADFALALFVSSVAAPAGFSTTVDKFPKVCALQQAVENLPNIKAWIEKRPKTEW